MRHAVYFMPGDDTALGRAGARWFGRWPDGGACPCGHRPELPPRLAGPARYGFHATLFAPCELASEVARGVAPDVDRNTETGAETGGAESGAGSEAFVRAIGTLAAKHRPIPLDGLRIVARGGYLALGLDAPLAAIDALAADCVRDLDRFRAPPDAAELARRGHAVLPPRERALLERWGYPHVMEAFSFHMTLAAPARSSATNSGTASGATVGDAAEGDLEDAPERYFGAALAGSPVLDRLALAVQEHREASFTRVAEFPLTGGRR